MMRAGAAQSNNKSASIAAELATRDALEQAGLTRAQVVFFFATAQHIPHYPVISKTIKKLTGAAHIVGASGYGIIGNDTEIEDRHGISIMVLDSEDLDAFSFLIPNLQESSFRAGETIARRLMACGVDPKLMVLFPDVFSFQSHLFFDGFEADYGHVPMIGGAAAENGKFFKTYQMEGLRVEYDSISGIAMGGNFRFETGISKSCQPFGESFQITKAEGNAIYEMDGRPAYDILLESLSNIHNQDYDDIMQNVFLGVPLQSYQTEFSRTNYLIRNITELNAKKGAVSCLSPVSEGDFVTFAVRDSKLARKDLVETLDDMRSRIHPDNAYFGLYFNSFTRGQGLYTKSSEDARLIRQYFPNLPLAGFFTYGEIAPVDHVNLLHLHSGILMIAAKSDD